MARRRARVRCAASLAILAGALPAGASAAVTIGPQTIEVKGAGVGAVIERSPLRITFTGEGGAPVLSEVQHAGAAELPSTRTTVDPADNPNGQSAYSPLTFLVGNASPSIMTTSIYAGQLSGEFSGDLESVSESGTEYGASEVLAAEAAGEGVRLTLATDDPSGRELTATLVPVATDRGPAMRVTVAASEPAGVAAMADSFASTGTEAFHGFGGRHDAIDQHGHEFFNWVNQESATETPSEPQNTYLYPGGPAAAYDPQAAFVSNQGYGFMLGSQTLSRWTLDAGAHPEAWQAQAQGAGLEYLVAPGSIAQAAGKLSAINGRQPAPPRWALGAIFDREIEQAEHAPLYEQQLREDLENFARYKLPVDAYRIEAWGFLSPSALEAEIAKLQAAHIRPMVYFRSFVTTSKNGTEQPENYGAALEGHYVATEAGGSPYVFTANYGSDAALIDFTDPAAVAWWRSRIDAALNLGIEGFMLDFGEQVLPGMHFHNGMSGTEMHNLYPIIYQRVTREIVSSWEAEHPGRGPIVFYTRSGYSGEPGSPAYANFNFPGDETTDYTHASGLASLAPDMLNRAVTGDFGYSTDIGGYFDFYGKVKGKEGGEIAPGDRELFLRWSEWAALSPIFRLHGAIIGEHVPWGYKTTIGRYRLLTRLHQAAAPLIEELWKEADRTGIPPTRPLYLEFPDDPVAAEQEQEWMLGPHVLVAPVVEKGVSGRSVYFPAGCWKDPETGLEAHGPQNLHVAANVKQLPFFFACGTRPFKPPAPLGKFG